MLPQFCRIESRDNHQGLAAPVKWDAQNEQIHHWGLRAAVFLRFSSQWPKIDGHIPTTFCPTWPSSRSYAASDPSRLGKSMIFSELYQLTKVAKKIQKVSNKIKKCEVSNYATHNPRQQITARWWLVMADQWACLGKIYGWNDGFSIRKYTEFKPKIFQAILGSVPIHSKSGCLTKILSQSKRVGKNPGACQYIFIMKTSSNLGGATGAACWGPSQGSVTRAMFFLAGSEYIATPKR